MVEVQGSPLKKFLIKQNLPIGFVLCVIFSLLVPAPGHAVYGYKVNGWKLASTINLCIIFFIFGLTTETSELVNALKSYKALVLGITGILVFTSFTGFLFMHLDFKPVEFGVGLAIFACVPTSLSSGVTLVISSYGHGALALLLTVTTNLLGIFISPIFVKLILGNIDASLDTMALLIKMVVSILMPLLVGKAVRELVPPVLHFAKKFKVPLYLFNNVQIIMIVWQTLSYSQHQLVEQKFAHILLAIMGAIMQHFLFLVMNSIIAWLARLKEGERKAYIIMASQKSLPTAAIIISYLNTDALNVGLMSIPCIVFYVMQLFIDSFIANSWSGKFERADALRAKYADQLARLAAMDDPETAMFLHLPSAPQVTIKGADVGMISVTAAPAAPMGLGGLSSLGVGVPMAKPYDPSATAEDKQSLLGHS